jgi:hypothetical protein
VLLFLSFSFGHCAKEKGQKDKQQNAQKKMIEGPAIPWPKEKDRRTSNTMVKRKRTEGQATQWLCCCPSVPFFWSLCCLSFCPFILVIVLLVILPFSFGHCVANGQKKRTEGQATQWPKEKEQKEKQHNDQKQGDRRTNNTMAKEKGQKDKQHNAQRKGTEGLGHCVACPSVLFFWPLCCLSFSPFLLVITGQKDKQHNGQRKGTEGQATQCPKENDRRTSNTVAKRK